MGYIQIAMIASLGMIFWAMPTWNAQVISMRVMTYLLVATVALFSLVPILTTIFPDDPQKKKQASQDQNILPGVWTMPIMSIWISNMFYIIPGVWMMVVMRYEASRKASPSLPGAPGEPKEIDHSLSVPVLPLHYFGLATLGVSFGTMEVLWRGRPPIDCIEGMMKGFFAAMIILVPGTAIWTLIRGDFKQWWNYREVWQPKIDPGLFAELDENDKTIGAASDEKRPLTP